MFTLRGGVEPLINLMRPTLPPLHVFGLWEKAKVGTDVTSNFPTKQLNRSSSCYSDLML